MSDRVEILCASPAETKAVAAAIATTLLPGDVILLDGDLGAGKTTFTQGLAQAMGVDEAVTSPTFTLVRSYPTAFGVELIHVDVYRLEDPNEIIALGLPELFEDRAVAVIEWGERALPAIGPDHLGVRLAFTDNECERHLTLEPAGARWTVRWEDLKAAAAAIATGAVP